MKELLTYPVEITLGDKAKTYSVEFQQSEEYAFSWKRVLIIAHGKAVVRCLCGGKGEKRLSIHSRSETDSFHLARFPDTGHEHAENCRFHSVDPSMSGLGNYKRGVVEELDDGSTKIKLKLGLQQRATKAPEDAPTSASANPPKVSGSRTNKTSMTLLGLLHYLWTRAGFNSWAPSMKGKRNLGVIHHYLMQTAASTYAGRIRLSRNLLVATSSDGSQARLNRAKACSAADERRRLVVVAPLAQYNEGAEYGDSLSIAGWHGIPYLSLSKDQWDVAVKRFSRELNAWAAGSRVVAIAQTDPPKRTGGSLQATVVDLALMLITKDWIPVDSSFEGMLAEKMVSENRKFEKPLRFDAEDAAFPDFLLKDTEQVIPLEVWGMSSPEYIARKREKVTHYNTTYGENGWWSWSAVDGDDIPPLPEHTASVVASLKTDSEALK